MQIMLVFEIQIFVHQIQPVDFWFNISYSASKKNLAAVTTVKCLFKSVLMHTAVLKKMCILNF